MYDKIVELKITYMQDNDCEDENKDGQYLTVQTQNNGVANFIIIETERWSLDLDEIDKFADTLKDFIKRLELVERNNK